MIIREYQNGEFLDKNGATAIAYGIVFEWHEPDIILA